MTNVIESTIINNLVLNGEYAGSVFPHLKEEYFESASHKTLFRLYARFLGEHTKIPTREVLELMLEKEKGVSADLYVSTKKLLDDMKIDATSDMKFLVKETESYVRKRARFNVIALAVKIHSGEEKNLTEDSIPEMFAAANAICFDSSVGLDYFEDSTKRFESMHRKEELVPFDINILNEITDGGLAKGTLTILMGTTSVGKTLMMTHMASANILNGKNVLYLTLEISANKISYRIDTNILDVSMKELKEMAPIVFKKRMDIIKTKGAGRLIVEQYAGGGAVNCNTFRNLIRELKLKKDFVPDILYVDYIGLCGSTRLKYTENSYNYMKSVAEELRGLAQELNIPVVSVVQTNRSGYGSDDVNLTNVSDSIGLPQTADIFLIVSSNDDLRAQGKVLFKQAKNRDNDLLNHNKFYVGIDYAKMKLHNLSDPSYKDSSHIASSSLNMNGNSSYGQTKTLFKKPVL